MFVSVALPLPLQGALTYRVPAGTRPGIGCRVVVPLGNRQVSGCVIATFETAPPGLSGELRDVTDVLDDEPFLPLDVVNLALWVAEYYMAGPGEAIASAVPPLTWVSSKSVFGLTGALSTTTDEARRGERSALEWQILHVIARTGPASLDALTSRVAKQTALAPDLERDPASVGRALRALVRAGILGPMRLTVGRADAARTQRVVRLGSSSARRGLALSLKQQAIVDALEEASGRLPLAQLRRRGYSMAALDALEARAVVSREDEAVERNPFAPGAWHAAGDGASWSSIPLVLTDEQSRTFDSLVARVTAGGFGVSLVHGVTGSGKTEVYLRLARHVQASGRGVLMLVPEIALTPAVASRFRRVFGDAVAVQHSGLSDGERYDQWRRVRRGEVSVVVGTRSAVFAPIAALGLVVVDEEHDTSYKQEETPRYHARDVALVRAQRAGALVVLGSATPSLETYAHAVSGKYQLLSLRHRVAERPMATVRVIDMRRVYADRGPDVVLSEELTAALGDRLQAAQQAVVLLNRRGFATNILCRQCGGAVECPNCSVTLTVHRAARLARCHYCDHSVALPESCASCGGAFVEYTGVGTEKVEAHVRTLFPSARVARVDRDTIRRRGAIGELLARFARRELDVLVGTQMIAKGHDFPQVTLVGVISADVGLGLADFRAAERTFQLLTQVAGRAGRGDQAGEAIVQTLHPEHYSIGFAKAQDYEGFFCREMIYRRAMHYPPHVSLINVVVRGKTAREALRDATLLRQAVGRDKARFSIVGPAPAPLARLRGEHRAQFLIKASHRAAARHALARALAQLPDLVRRVSIDVDPQSVL